MDSVMEIRVLDFPQVAMAEECRLGQFANAFRVLDNDESDCFLDFLIYSALENQASVVSRVCVRRDLIPVLRDHLSNVLREIISSNFRICHSSHLN